MKTRKTKDALEIIEHKLVRGNEKLEDMILAESLSFRVAQMIYDARAQAGLTQHQLADLVGTSQSAIARVEDADYEGHSLSMLNRIAKALGKEIYIHFQEPSRSESPERRTPSASDSSTRGPTCPNLRSE